MAYFFQFYPDKTWTKNWMTIDINNGKKWKISETVKKILILFFFTKDCGYKCIGLFAIIAKHDIRNRKLITFDCLRSPNLEEIVWEEKNEDIAVCWKDFAIP